MSQSGIDLSLDEIIKENKSKKRDSSQNRGRGRGGVRGRGRGRGRGGAGPSRGGAGVRGRGARGGLRGRGVVKRGTVKRGRGNPVPRGRNARGTGRPVLRQSRSRTPARINNQNGSRSVSRTRYPSNNNANRAFQRSRSRSRSRTQFLPNDLPNNPRSRSRSRSRLQNQNGNLPNIRARSRSRSRNRQNIQQNFRSRSRTPGRQIPKTGIAARLGNNPIRNYSEIGLRSDMILREQQNQIRSQTFTRSGSLPKTPATYTVSVANDRLRRPLNRQRRNSFSNVNNRIGHLDNQSINKVNATIGGNLRTARLPGGRGAIRGRGRGRSRGGINFVNRQILNPQLQMEIAALQGKTYQEGKVLHAISADPTGINFVPTPHLTTTKLSDRFNCL